MKNIANSGCRQREGRAFTIADGLQMWIWRIMEKILPSIMDLTAVSGVSAAD